LVKAVRAHKIGTLGFPAYAKRYMRGSAARTVMAMQSNETSFDPADYAWADTAPRDAVSDMTVEVIDLISVLTPEQQVVTVAYYVADLRLDDIAAELRISKPAVSQRLGTIHQTLRPVVELAVAA
jgi:DNA-directed RNA polymerase specialized sigma24 family protein